MPTTGRRVRWMITRLRCSLGLSRRVLAELDGAIPLTSGRPSREGGNDLGAHTVGGFGDDPVDDRAQVSGLFVDLELPVGTRAAAHDLEGVLDLAAAAELVHDVVHEPLQHL